MISPFSLSAVSIATVLLPDAVGPTIAITGELFEAAVTKQRISREIR